ncbi:MAG TPA: 3-oxoacyl-[acyl-carrier-protein] reductase [Acidimicrobiales bacterium]|nr:3-oxoacyl-[acyl-carrier-protein] reductase [Acidimicrobiales bacterium]
MTVAFVTGGSRGIGRATALALAEAGHVVAVGWSRDEQGAGKTAAEIEERGGRAAPVQVDVADPGSVDAAFSAVEADLGPVGVLVNNAGVTHDGLLLRMPDQQWQEVLRTNLDGAFHAIRRALPGMVRARTGRIVNVGSVAGLLGSAGQANYAAAKAGLVGLTRSVARELASRGVTCNVVAPGPIATAMLDALPEARVEDLARQVPVGRLGTPEEVAAVIAFLCSDAAAYVTGAVVPVDGGLGMGH